QFDARWLAQFVVDQAAVNYYAGLVAAVLDRADRLAERLSAERLVVVERQVARVARFARHREIDRALEQRRVDACFRGRLALPERVGIVDALRVYAERNEQQPCYGKTAAQHLLRLDLGHLRVARPALEVGA